MQNSPMMNMPLPGIMRAQSFFALCMLLEVIVFPRQARDEQTETSKSSAFCFLRRIFATRPADALLLVPHWRYDDDQRL